jgi:hypothetical protein
MRGLLVIINLSSIYYRFLRQPCTLKISLFAAQYNYLKNDLKTLRNDELIIDLFCIY